MVNATLAGLLTIACGVLMPSTPVALVLVTIFAYGVTRSMQFSTLATLAYADVGDQQKSPASTLWSVAQQMTIGMGIAFGALALRAVSFIRGESGAADHSFSMPDFQWAFAIAGVLTLVSVIGYAGMAKDAGSGIGGGADARRAAR